MRTAVLGSGSWGTALAQVLCDNQHTVRVWGIKETEVTEINTLHTNSAYFGSTPIAEGVVATTDLAAALTGAETVVLCVPTKAMASVVKQATPYLEPDALLVNAAKGFDPATDLPMSETIRRTCANAHPVVSIVGPSHAEEVILRKLTSICAVSPDETVAKQVQELFSNSYLRLYGMTDEVGAECGAAVKNVIALASGMLTGLGYGDNAKAALITRGMQEILRYGLSLGAKKDTFFGLTGVGDLIVTCFSPHSRNYQAGLAIGQADDAGAFLATNQKTVEGIYSCKVIAKEAEKRGIEMPIVSEVYRVLFEQEKPSVAVRTLMNRPLKAE